MPTVKPRIKDDDLFILDEIKALLSSRPTYGYRRITARLNAKYSQQPLKKINSKRIYRVIFENKLLFAASIAGCANTR